MASRRRLWEPHTISLWRPFLRGKDILEIGCGNAYFLSRVLDCGFRSYLGIDTSDDMIRRNRERFERTGNIPSVRFDVGDVETLDSVPAGGFDVIVSYWCLHHLEHPEKAIRLAHASLREGGMLLAFEGNREPDRVEANLYNISYNILTEYLPALLHRRGYEEVKRATEPEGEYWKHHPGHLGLRTPAEYRAALLEAGFKCFRIDCFHSELLHPRLWDVRPQGLRRILLDLTILIGRGLEVFPSFRESGETLRILAVK